MSGGARKEEWEEVDRWLLPIPWFLRVLFISYRRTCEARRKEVRRLYILHDGIWLEDFHRK